MDREDKRVLKALLHDRKRFIIALDIDGCLCETMPWTGFDNFGPIRKDIHTMLWNYRKNQNAYILVHSCRATNIDNKPYKRGIEAIKRFLKNNGVPFDDVWSQPGKPFAHMYLDDRARNPDCPCCMKRP